MNEAFKIVEILELNFGNGNTCTIFTIFRSFKIGKQNLSPLHGRKIEYSATSIPRNTGRNIGNIRGYSEVFARNISGILVVFCSEYVGINYTRYSEAEYCRNTTDISCYKIYKFS